MAIRGFLVFAILMTIGLSGEALFAQNIDGEAFTETLTSIAEKASLPGAYKGKVAIEFANYFNSMIEQYPIETVKINALTNRVADEYSIKFTLNGNIMESAQFPTRAAELEKDEGKMNTVATQDSAWKEDHEGQKESESALEEKPLDKDTETEYMPRFPGCEDLNGTSREKYDCAVKKMLQYVYSKNVYPPEAIKNGIQGQVVAKFTVGEDGRLYDIYITKSLGYGCDDAFLDTIESMNDMEERWTPGMQKGKLVAVQFSFPFKYKLQ
jgi:TonB family protein